MEVFLRPDEDQVDREIGKGLESTGDGCTGGVIAPHGIQGNAHARPPL
jgi:hypothetical protein